jgi:hypothetical protein
MTRPPTGPPRGAAQDALRLDLAQPKLNDYSLGIVNSLDFPMNSGRSTKSVSCS